MRVQSLGCIVQGLGFRDSGLGFGVLRFRVDGEGQRERWQWVLLHRDYHMIVSNDIDINRLLFENAQCRCRARREQPKWL